jgi:MFS family permease
MGASSASPSSPELRRILQVLFGGVFMAALDTAIIAPAIPALQAAFNVDTRQIALITIVYLLGSLSSNALMANLSDRHGRRPVYLACVAAFGLGSLSIALAPSYGLVLLGRLIQGISAGGITPAASAVIGDTFPPEQRGRALGLIGATFGMAFIIGPLVASMLLVVVSWHWLFLINVPVAALIIALGMRVLPPAARPAAALPPFDLSGLLVVATLLTSLALGITRTLDDALGVSVWPWMLGLSLGCVPLLVWVERSHARPVFPLHMFSTRQLRLTYVLALGAGFSMGSVIFIAALAVAAFGFATQQAGFALFPLVIASLVGSIGSGRALNQLGSRLVLQAGFATALVGSIILGVRADALALFIIATILVGFGVGVVVGGVLRFIVLSETAPGERTVAQGLINICTSIGNLLSAALIGTIADSAGGGVAGLSTAYLVAAGLALVMLLLSLGLKSRAQELGDAAARPEHAGAAS